MIRRHYNTLTVFGFALLLTFLQSLQGATQKVNPDSLQVAQQVEEAFSSVVNLAKPAVVVITNKQVPARMQQQQELPEEFYRFFGFPRPQENYRGSPRRGRRQRPVPAGKGSGVLIAADGYLVTNHHVIEGNSFLEVRTSEGKIYDNEKDPEAVKIVGIDKETDLAVLQIGGGKEKDLPFLEFADSDNLQVGQWAIAIGAPFNLDYSVTIGCISQKGRYDTGMSSYENYIQTDASINPGNSGGPLLNIHAQIIGINQFIYTGGMSRGSIGLGFAIASNLVKQVSESLVQDGEVVRPFIGVAMQELSSELGGQFGAAYGVIVSEVLPGEAAEKAGLQNGDVIQMVGERKVHSPHELLLAVTSYKPGDKIQLQVLRHGKNKSFTLVAGQRSNSALAKGGDLSNSYGRQGSVFNQLGLRLKVEESQLVVQEVREDGAVAKAADSDGGEIRPGDIIHEVNRIPVKSVTEFVEALEKTQNDMVVFYLERQNPRQGSSNRFFLAIPIESKKEE
ncbi:MAG: trypsin-like peptidase domain-containing protein [Lentisphaeria bacterium]|nr:trypsin-like peptidase domain-containing protein [Lentisphaeria bacterium]